MRRYDAYRDSDVEWIGEIPAGWGIGRFSNVCTSTLGKMLTNEPDSEGAFRAPYLKAANVQEGGFELGELSEMYFNPDEVSRYEIVKGDLLIVEGGTVGLAQVWDGSVEGCFIQNAIHRVRPLPGFNVRYLKYCVDLARLSGYVNLVCNKATISHFTKKKFLNTPLPMPSYSEQCCIASYLDAATSEIDALANKIEQSIELLQEYRKAVISETVTKGLDPDAPMKDSGIEWIGQIPVKWKTNTISGVTTMITNGYVGPTRGLFVDAGIRYLQSLHIVNGKIDFYKHPYYVPEKWSALHSRSILATGDVLVVQTGAIGNCACVDDRYAGCNCHALIVLRPDSFTIMGQYLNYYLLSDIGKEKLLLSRTGATHPHLNATKIRSTPVLVPPIDEQYDIVACLDTKTAEIDGLIDAKRLMADKLREYRKSLISEAVTGKFKVPGVA